MGGHAAGREAAELAIVTIGMTFDQAPEGADPAETLRTAIHEANCAIHTMHTNEVAFGRPGCTVVAILMHPNGTEVAHVGDSRAYLVHKGQIARITRDHSIVQELVDRGLITAQQAARHPDASRITRALGMVPDVEVDVRPSPVTHVAGDSFVLCSDGLTDLVDDEEIKTAVETATPAEAVDRLVDLANARGGHDNITVIVLRAGASACPPAATLAEDDPDEPVESSRQASPLDGDTSRTPSATPDDSGASSFDSVAEPLIDASPTSGRPDGGGSIWSAVIVAGFLLVVVLLGLALASHLRHLP
jgi:protein phosphatase